MGAKSQAIASGAAIALDATNITTESIITYFNITNRAAGTIAYSLYKTDGVSNYYLRISTTISSGASVEFTTLRLQPGWKLMVTVSGAADIDCNWKN